MRYKTGNTQRNSLGKLKLFSYGEKMRAQNNGKSKIGAWLAGPYRASLAPSGKLPFSPNNTAFSRSQFPYEIKGETVGRVYLL
jgi:hypothetical protein